MTLKPSLRGPRGKLKEAVKVDYCEYYEECKNRESPKCVNCEYNKNNLEAIERDENKSDIYKHPGKYYRYSNHYEPE